MGLAQRLGRHATIYLAASILPRAMALLLLPLYTRFFSPEDYGTLSVVTALTGLLLIAFTLSTHAAVTRFYFEYRADPPRLREFWGSVLVLIALLSFGGGGLLLLAGGSVARPVLAGVAFWPYLALGIGAAMFTPFVQLLFSVMQTREQARAYAIYSVAQSILTLSLTVGLVILFRWGAEGPLTATLVTMVVFFVISMARLRGDVTLCLRPDHLRNSLLYSLPLVPHALAAQVLAVTDRLLLSSMIGVDAAGIYTVAVLVAQVMVVASDSVNRAYVPMTMDVLKSKRQQDLEELLEIGTSLMVGACVAALILSAFAKEIVWLLTTPAFYEGYVYVPYLAFAAALGVGYLILSNMLFFDRSATKYIAAGTVLGASITVTASLLLVPQLGPTGAAVATLLGQATMTIVVGWFGYRIELIRWPYWRIGGAFILCLCTALLIVDQGVRTTLLSLGARVAICTGAMLVSSWLVWRAPFRLPIRSVGLLRALFLRPRPEKSR